MSEITIRLGELKDADNIAAMLIKLADELGDGDVFLTTKETIARYGFGDTAMFQVALAENGAKTVGMALYFAHFSTTKAKPGVYVQDLWVSDEVRGGRIGQNLLAYVANRAEKAWGAGYIKLSVHLDNPRAKRFYERLKFTKGDNELPMTVEIDALEKWR